MTLFVIIQCSACGATYCVGEGYVSEVKSRDSSLSNLLMDLDSLGLCCKKPDTHSLSYLSRDNRITGFSEHPDLDGLGISWLELSEEKKVDRFEMVLEGL